MLALNNNVAALLKGYQTVARLYFKLKLLIRLKLSKMIVLILNNWLHLTIPTMEKLFLMLTILSNQILAVYPSPGNMRLTSTF